MLRLFRLMRLRQRGDGESETERDGDGQHEVNQSLQYRNKFDQPLATGAREENVGEQAVTNNNDQDDADDGLGDFRPGPLVVAENEIADEKSDDCSNQLREDSEREIGAAAGAEQARFDQLFKGFNIFLKFTAQEFAALSVKTVEIRDENQQSAEQRYGNVNGHESHCGLLADFA